MKPILLSSLLTLLLGLGATTRVPAAPAAPPAAAEMRVLFEQDVEMYAKERGPNDGAPGASATAFRVSDSVQGVALIVGLDQPVLGVFVGISVPEKHSKAPFEDLVLTFTLDDDTTRIVKAGAGGGAGFLFQSPEDVPMTRLRKVALSVDKKAKWVK